MIIPLSFTFILEAIDLFALLLDFMLDFRILVSFLIGWGWYFRGCLEWWGCFSQWGLGRLIRIITACWIAVCWIFYYLSYFLFINRSFAYISLCFFLATNLCYLHFIHITSWIQISASYFIVFYIPMSFKIIFFLTITCHLHFFDSMLIVWILIFMMQIVFGMEY